MKDPTKIDCWSALQLRVKHQEIIWLISAYRVSQDYHRHTLSKEHLKKVIKKQQNQGGGTETTSRQGSSQERHQKQPWYMRSL